MDFFCHTTACQSFCNPYKHWGFTEASFYSHSTTDVILNDLMGLKLSDFSILFLSSPPILLNQRESWSHLWTHVRCMLLSFKYALYLILMLFTKLFKRSLSNIFKYILLCTIYITELFAVSRTFSSIIRNNDINYALFQF